MPTERPKLHAVPRLADAQRVVLQTDVCKRHPLDSGHAVGTGQHPVVQDAVRADAAVVGRKAGAAGHPARQRLRHGVFLRFGARLDGLRRLCPFGRRGAARQPRGLRSPARQRGFRRLLGHLGRTVPAIHGRGAFRNPGTLLRHALHPLVAPSVRRTRPIRKHAARRLHQNPQGRGVTTTTHSASFSNASAAKSGSAARFFVFVADHVSSENSHP